MPNFAVNIKSDTIGKLSQKQVSLFSIAFLTALLAYPLSTFASEYLGIQSNILSVGARALTVLITITYGVFLIVNRLFRPVPIFYIFILFWIILSIRIIYDTTNSGWQLGRPAYDYFLFGIVLSFLCSIPFFVPVKPNYDTIEKYAWVGLVLLNILGVFNVFKAKLFLIERFSGNEKFNPISFGMFAALLAITSLFKLLKRDKSIVAAAVYIGCIFLGILNLVLSASKSPILFFVITIVLYVLWLWGKGRKKPLFFLLLCIALILGTFFALGLQDFFFIIQGRLSDVSSDDSSLERLDMLGNAWEQFKEQPFFGSFLEEKIYKQYPHNLTLEAFMATGIAGGFFFLVFYFNSIRNIFRCLFKTSFGFVSVYALCLSIVTLFSGSLIFSFEFWIAFGHINSLVFSLEAESKTFDTKPFISLMPAQ